jgi:hypothetical protein
MPSNFCSAKTRELPHNVPYAVKVQMMRSPLEQWWAHIEHCFADVQPLIQEGTNNIVEEVFKDYLESPLVLRVK